MGQQGVVRPAASGESTMPPLKDGPFSTLVDSCYLGKWGSELADFLFSARKMHFCIKTFQF